MRSVQSELLCVLTLTFASSCAPSQPPASAPATESARSAAAVTPAADAVALGHFETREHRVTWLTSSDAPRFTVRTKDGELLASDLSQAEVAERFPALRDFTLGLVETPSGPVLDASKPILDASGGYYDN